jgi:hypothetical protein
MLRTFLKEYIIDMKKIPYVLLLGLLSCGEDSPTTRVPDVPVTLQTHRFDKAIAAIDTNQLQTGVQQVMEQYPDFLPFYVARLLPFAAENPEMDQQQHIEQAIGYLLTDKDYRGVFDTTLAHFPDVQEVNKQLERGFKYLKHYIPEYEIPEIIYFVSGLNNWTAITYEDERKFLGIGLDMFFGANYPYYASVGVPHYMTQRLLPASIPVHAFRAIYEELYPFTAEGQTLLDMMIQRGKAQYFLSQVLPFIPDTLQLGYTKAQLTWCEENEAMIYNFFIRENLLYETNWQKILRYVNDGPTSTGMPSESPGNIGSWLGLQIIKAYMKRHPEKSLTDLLATTDDGQKTLQAAKYKPR